MYYVLTLGMGVVYAKKKAIQGTNNENLWIMGKVIMIAIIGKGSVLHPPTIIKKYGFQPTTTKLDIDDHPST